MEFQIGSYEDDDPMRTDRNDFYNMNTDRPLYNEKLSSDPY